MADNIGIMDSTGNTRNISAKDSSSVFHQRQLIEFNDTTPTVASASTPLPVAVVPSTDGGASVSFDSAADETVHTIKASAGKLLGISIANYDNAPRFAQIYDVSGTVTVGTTTPTLVLPIPAGSGAAFTGQFSQFFGDGGIAFANAIKIAITTTATGATGPTQDLVASYWYK